MMIYLLTFLTALLISAGLTPLAMRLGLRLGMVNHPGGAGSTTGRSGPHGRAGPLWRLHLDRAVDADAAPHFAAGVGGLVSSREDPKEMQRLIALLPGAYFPRWPAFWMTAISGPAVPNIWCRSAAALIAMAGLIFLKHVNNPFAPGFFFGEDGFPWWIVAPLTIFWFMGMMNTVNWLDGLSGLVTGITAILCIVLAVHMLVRAEPPQLSVAILPIALLGAAVGFLPFNFASRIFMGSSGSYFLGFALAALGIIGGAHLAAVMMVMGLPWWTWPG